MSSPGNPAPSVIRLSVVIPVLDDLDALASLLERLQTMQPAPAEIIVVDGCDSPACRELCELQGCDYCTSPSGRGIQLHAGALRARGDVLWFLHADALPAADAQQVIAAHLDNGHNGGWFGFSFTGPASWYKTVLAGLSNLRAKIGIPYGDQGLFARRDAYLHSDGFAQIPLFEEVQLVRSLRRAGRFRAAPASIGVSPRRWERDGWLRRSLANRCLALAFSAGVAPDRLASLYRPVPAAERAREQRYG